MLRCKPGLRHAATVAASITVLVAAASSGLTEQDRAGAAPDTTPHRHGLPGALAQIVAGTPAATQPLPTVVPAPAVAPVTTPRPVAASTLAANGVPTTALRAYQRAAAAANRRDGDCHIPWPLVAAIGRVESDHGRFHGAVLHTDGVSTPGIVGIPLDGRGTEVIRDTDRGALDGDRTYDRAVGPMQFIPSTWARWRTDADHDGKADPNDIDDAAAATAAYLCSAGGDLRTYAAQRRAVHAYNHSTAYFTSVFALEKLYARGVTTVPTAPGHGDARLPRPAHRPAPHATAQPTRTAPAPTTHTPGTSATNSEPSTKPSTPKPSTSPSTSPATPKPSTSPSCPKPSATPSPSASPTPSEDSSCPTPTASASAATASPSSSGSHS